MDTLISVWSALNSSNNNNSDLSVSASDKEKVVEAVSSVIAALSSTEKPARLITILSGILSDTRSALMHVANIRREQQQQRDTSIAESSAGLDRIRVADHLRYLKACCRGVGSTVSDPDGEEEDDFEVILDNVDKGGEKRQGSATNAHPPPPPTLLQLNPELKRRESEATQLVWSVVQDTIALFGNDEEIMTVKR